MNRMLPFRLFGLVLIALLTSFEPVAAEREPICVDTGSCTLCLSDDMCYVWWCDDGDVGYVCDDE